MLFTLLLGAFNLCSNDDFFHQKIDKLKNTFENNTYPPKFVDICTEEYLDKVLIKKEVVLKGFKEELIYILTSIGKATATENLFSKLYRSKLKFCKLKIIFQSPCKLNLLFHYQDTRVLTARLLVVVKKPATFLLELEST